MPGAPARDVHALALDPQNPDRIYIWAEVVGFFVSSNGGATWETMDSSKPLGDPVQVITLAASHPTGSTGLTLYAGTNLGLYVSTDGGGNWSPVKGEVADQPIYALLALDGPRGIEIYAGTATSAFYSPDGATWRNLPAASALGGVGGLALDASAGKPEPGRLMAVNGSNQVFASSDSGQTWTPLAPSPGG